MTLEKFIEIEERYGRLGDNFATACTNFESAKTELTHYANYNRNAPFGFSVDLAPYKQNVKLTRGELRKAEDEVDAVELERREALREMDTATFNALKLKYPFHIWEKIRDREINYREY